MMKRLSSLFATSILLLLAACTTTRESADTLTAEQIIAAVDSGDPARYAKLLTEDSTFRFGNYPAVEGKDAIFSAQTDFYASVKSTQHQIIRVWQNTTAIVAEMLVTYVRHDSSTITLPVVDIFEIDDNKISATKIYMDISPLDSTQ